MPYTPGVKILDLGCGPATNTYLYCPGDYLGIDISDRYIKSAQRQFPNHKFMCCDFMSLNNEYQNSYDLIIMSGLLHHLDDKTADKFIKKAGKVLKVGGHLIIIDNCLHSSKQHKAKNYPAR